VRAFSRHGRDWTGPYKRVVDAAAKLSCKAALIDGELIVQDENGISDFDALRSAIHQARHRLVLFAFDLLHLDGKDLRKTPLIERRAALRKLVQQDPARRSSSAIMSRAMALSSLRLQPSSDWRALSPSARVAYIVLVDLGIGSRRRIWSRAILFSLGPRSTTAVCPGPCWLANGMVGWSLQEQYPPSHARAEWSEKFAKLSIEKPALRG
jgi:ATP dependent DNA ligase domain